MGLLCLSSSELLLTTELGNRICLGMAAFWSIRLIFQFFVYSQTMERKNFRNHCSHLFQLPLALYQCRILESYDKFLNLINLPFIAQEDADNIPS